MLDSQRHPRRDPVRTGALTANAMAQQAISPAIICAAAMMAADNPAIPYNPTPPEKSAASINQRTGGVVSKGQQFRTAMVGISEARTNPQANRDGRRMAPSRHWRRTQCSAMSVQLAECNHQHRSQPKSVRMRWRRRTATAPCTWGRPKVYLNTHELVRLLLLRSRVHN